MSGGFRRKRIAALRATRAAAMTSALDEYCPAEFDEALDEIERLQALVVKLGGNPHE